MMPVSSSYSTSFILLLTLCLSQCAFARFDYPVCCSQANNASSLFTKNNQTQAYLPLLGDYTTCDQTYNASIPAAANAYVSYRYCKTQCRGFQLSQANQPGAWAAPVVQFILPSIIFSMSIPRRTMFLPTWKMELGFRSLSLGLALSILTALDTLMWVAVILTLAGPLMISGLHEALLDYRILRALSPNRQSHPLNDASRLRLIVIVVCGNLLLHDNTTQTRECPLIAASDASSDPLREIPEALEQLDHEDRKAKLLSLMSAQGDFGALVGAPVIFYLGGFIYTILDLLNDPSVQDAAISLAFGVEWMIVVHVAIISGCLLASNDPSAVSVMAGQRASTTSNPNATSNNVTAPLLTGQLPVTSSRSVLPLVYDSRFQPVSMWQRGSNKANWLEAVTTDQTRPYQRQALLDVRSDVIIGASAYCFWVILFMVVLISLPPAAGAVVAWKTPPNGWGCRSLTLVCYAGIAWSSLQESRQAHNVRP